MFTFMKKDKQLSEQEKEEKEKRKREKREKKERHKSASRDDLSTSSKLSRDELLRLDQLRISLKKSASYMGASLTGGGSDKEKLPSGIIADYRDSFLGNVENEAASGRKSSSRPTSLQGPPRPPSRGILKGKNSNSQDSVASTAATGRKTSASLYENLDDESLLLKNTQANEFLYENLRAAAAAAAEKSPHKTMSPGESADREVAYEEVPGTVRVRAHADHVSPVSPPQKPLRSALGLPPKRPSSTTKPLSHSELKSLICGESLGVNQRPLSSDFTLHLPGIRSGLDSGPDSDLSPDSSEPASPNRDVVVQRVPGREDFGILLKRITLSRAGGGAVGLGENSDVYLVECELKDVFMAGDQLLAVNGVTLKEGISKDEVMDMIRNTRGEAVILKVRINDLIRKPTDNRSPLLRS